MFVVSFLCLFLYIVYISCNQMNIKFSGSFSAQLPCMFCFVQTYKKLDQNKKAEELDKMKAKYGLSTPEAGGKK